MSFKKLMVGVSLMVSAAMAQTSLWPNSRVPGSLQASDSSSVNLGLKFYSTVSGSITAIRFYKAGANTGTHVGSLWSAAGARLASVTFTGETASGWQQMNLPTPLQISANTTYVVSYHAPRGAYSYDQNFGWSTATSGSLRVSGSSPGVFSYSGSPAFPTNVYRSSNYWVDVVFTTSTSSGGGTTTPSTYTISGNSGVSGVTLTLSGPAAKSVTSDSSGNYSFTGLAAGSYVVAASRSGYTFNPTTRSVSVTTANVSGVNFSATASSTPVPRTVTLSWRAPSSTQNVKGYNVYRTATSGGQYTKVNASPTASLTYVDSGVTNGRTYWYAVTAVDTNNAESDYSNIATAVVP